VLVAAPVTRYDELLARLRGAARPSRKAPADFGPYLDKVRRAAYQVTDGDVQALLDDGYSEDEVFEQTVSAAAAAGFERLTAGLEALP
jgi:hypothetical protein